MFSSLSCLQHQLFLEVDNRRSQGRRAISFSKLEEIVNEAKGIPVNLGNSSIKINRMYAEAKTWFDEYKPLLVKCGIQLEKVVNESDCSQQKVSIDEVNKAIEVATNDVTTDLEEVKQLEVLVSQSQDWFDSALEFAPKRNKRTVRSKKDLQNKHSIQQVVSLIDRAGTIPMDTSKDLERLRMLLSDVKSWRLQAQVKLREITAAFGSLREVRIRYYGSPDRFLEAAIEKEHEQVHIEEETEAVDNDIESLCANGNQSDSEESSIRSPSKSNFTNGGNNVYKIVSNLVKSAEVMSIYSFEEEVAEKLLIISKWCKKAALLIASHTDVYINKRWKKDLDSLICEGEGLRVWNDDTDFTSKTDTEEMVLLTNLKKNVDSFISGDIERLKILRIHRDNFYSWCDKANKAYTEGDKKVPLETLKILAEESQIYPPSE